jgi:hypothetical protein
VALIAAPPVENRRAAPRRYSRWEDISVVPPFRRHP